MTHERLFSYGTLRQREVQRAIFGRTLAGRSDSLVGYVLAPLDISDARVIRLSGSAVHPIARWSGNRDDRVSGTLLELTRDELEAADRYEVDGYRRRPVVLASGTRAFAYVGPDLALRGRPAPRGPHAGEG